MPAAIRREPKKQMECEALIRWAYREELSKRTTSSAEGIWDRIQGGRLGIITDPGHGAAQRYSHFGLPHPDAERIEAAVNRLEDLQIDWELEAGAIMGDLIALLDDKHLNPAPAPVQRTSKATWGVGRGRSAIVRPPRRVGPRITRALRTRALVTMHAGMGTRPEWQEEPPYPTAIWQGSKITIVGECRGKNLYTAGSYCPLEWSPSPLSVIETRADYLAWWRGLKEIADTLDLESFNILPPAAAEMPWRDNTEEVSFVHPTVWPKKYDILLLAPKREQAGPPLRRSRYPGRTVEVDQ